MRNIINITTGALYKTVAPALVVAGFGAQQTAKGILITGEALHGLGVNTELRGHKLHDIGDKQIEDARIGFAKSRDERKAERAQSKAQRAAEREAARQARVRELEAMRFMREQFKRATEEVDLNAVAAQARASKEREHVVVDVAGAYA